MMKLLLVLGFVALAHCTCTNNKNVLTAKKPWMPPGPALGVEILLPEESLAPEASAPGGPVPLSPSCNSAPKVLPPAPVLAPAPIYQHAYHGAPIGSYPAPAHYAHPAPFKQFY